MVQDLLDSVFVKAAAVGLPSGNVPGGTETFSEWSTTLGQVSTVSSLQPTDMRGKFKRRDTVLQDNNVRAWDDAAGVDVKELGCINSPEDGKVNQNNLEDRHDAQYSLLLELSDFSLVIVKVSISGVKDVC